MTDLASSPAGAAPDLTALPLEGLRAHRRTLLEESARAARWRRLVQARLDLAVDAAAPVEPLGPSCAPLLDVVRSARSGGDPVEQLRRAGVARAEVLRYAAQLRADLERATDELVDRYTCQPARCLGAVPPGGSQV